jgi:hypothetical protein
VISSLQVFTPHHLILSNNLCRNFILWTQWISKNMKINVLWDVGLCSLVYGGSRYLQNIGNYLISLCDIHWAGHYSSHAPSRLANCDVLCLNLCWGHQLYNQGFWLFSQSLQTYSLIVPQLGHNCFLPNPLQFFIHHSSYHSTLYSADTYSVLNLPHTLVMFQNMQWLLWEPHGSYSMNFLYCMHWFIKILTSQKFITVTKITK